MINSPQDKLGTIDGFAEFIHERFPRSAIGQKRCDRIDQAEVKAAISRVFEQAHAAFRSGTPFKIESRERQQVPGELIEYLTSRRGFGFGSLSIAGFSFHKGDPLELDCTAVTGTLEIIDCDLADHTIVLTGARLECLNLSGSEVAFLDCSHLECRGNVELAGLGCSRFRSNDGVSFSNARITGLLNLSGAHLGRSIRATPKSYKDYPELSFNGDALRCRSNVFMNEGFSAEGQVLLNDSSIHGSLDAQRGWFSASDKRVTAISLKRAMIEGSLFVGGRRRSNVPIEPQCKYFEELYRNRQAALKAKNKPPLNPETACFGSINLTNSEINGLLDLRNTYIECTKADPNRPGDLNFRIPRASSPERQESIFGWIPYRSHEAIACRGAIIRGSALFDSAHLAGTLSVEGSKFERLVSFSDCVCSSPTLADKTLSKVTGEVPQVGYVKWTPPAILATGATFSANLEFSDATVYGLVDLRQSRINGSLKYCGVHGEALLRGYDESDQELLEYPHIALNLDNAHVDGTLTISACDIRGGISLNRAVIQEDLFLQPGSAGNSGSTNTVRIDSIPATYVKPELIPTPWANLPAIPAISGRRTVINGQLRVARQRDNTPGWVRKRIETYIDNEWKSSATSEHERVGSEHRSPARRDAQRDGKVEAAGGIPRQPTPAPPHCQTAENQHQLPKPGVDPASVSGQKGSVIELRGGLYFRQARIGSHVTIEGLHQSIDGRNATLCFRGARVGGSFRLARSSASFGELGALQASAPGQDLGLEVRHKSRVPMSERSPSTYESRIAIDLRSARIEGNAFGDPSERRDQTHPIGAQVLGCIDLSDCRIGAHLDFRGFALWPCPVPDGEREHTNPYQYNVDPVLKANHLRVDKSFAWQPSLAPPTSSAHDVEHGDVDLRDAVVDLLDDDPDSWPADGHTKIRRFGFDRIRDHNRRGSGNPRSYKQSLVNSRLKILRLQYRLSNQFAEERKWSSLDSLESNLQRVAATVGKLRDDEQKRQTRAIEIRASLIDPDTPDSEKTALRRESWMLHRDRFESKARELVLRIGRCLFLLKHHAKFRAANIIERMRALKLNPFGFGIVTSATIGLILYYLWPDLRPKDVTISFIGMVIGSFLVASAVLVGSLWWMGRKARAGAREHDRQFSPDTFDTLADAFDRMGLEGESTQIKIAKVREEFLFGKMPFLQRLGLFVLSFFGYGLQPWKGVVWIVAVALLGFGYFTFDKRVWPSRAGFFSGGSNIGTFGSLEGAALEGTFIATFDQRPSTLVTEIFEGMDSSFGRDDNSVEAISFRKQHIDPPGYPKFNPLIYSSDVLLPFVDLHQEEYWVPTTRIGKVVFWMLKSLGWLISTFTLVAVTKRVR